MTHTSESNDIYKTARSGEILAGKYRLLRQLGRGGMGTVYEAEHTRVERHFAVKFLSKELSKNRDFIKRFDLEAKTGGRLNHENIIAVIDSGIDAEETPFFVMEYLEGCSLRNILEEYGELGIDRSVDIIVQACSGINAAHSQNIIHRDLKPDNLFIAQRDDGSDWVKILDFGIAKLLKDSISGVYTKPGSVLGTFQYMPQEQLNDASSIDHRTDIYSLGVILYEMLSISLPHPGESLERLIFHIMKQEPVSLRAVNPGLPEELVEIVHKAISSNPDDRYATVRDFKAALAPFSLRSLSSIPYPSSESSKSSSQALNVTIPKKISSKTFREDRERTEVEPPVEPSSIRPDIGKSSRRQGKLSETEIAKEAAGLSSQHGRVIYVLIVASFFLVLVIAVWFWISGREETKSIESDAQSRKSVDKSHIPTKGHELRSEPSQEGEGRSYAPASLAEEMIAPTSSVADGRTDGVAKFPHGQKSGHALLAKPSNTATISKKRELEAIQNKSVGRKVRDTILLQDTGKKGSKKIKTFIRKKGQRNLKFIDGNPYE